MALQGSAIPSNQAPLSGRRRQHVEEVDLDAAKAFREGAMSVLAVSRFAHRFLAACVAALSLAACASQPGKPVWGEQATITPGWDRIGDAALKAVTDPFTWAPVAGALALQIGDLDNEIADWANKETPLFGSRGNADDASDWLRSASFATYVATALAAPAGDGGDWFGAKAKGFAVGGAAVAATELATRQTKIAAGRNRPLGQNDSSFPSRHASLTAVAARLSHETLRYYDLSRGETLAADAGLAGLVIVTAWARVEAGEHHPTDVLAGAALGNFFAVFATEAFLHPAVGDNMALKVEPSRDGWVLSVTFAL